MCCSVLQRVAVCRFCFPLLLLIVASSGSHPPTSNTHTNTSRNVLQCIAVCCSALHCVAVRFFFSLLPLFILASSGSHPPISATNTHGRWSVRDNSSINAAKEVTARGARHAAPRAARMTLSLYMSPVYVWGDALGAWGDLFDKIIGLFCRISSLL